MADAPWGQHRAGELRPKGLRGDGKAFHPRAVVAAKPLGLARAARGKANVERHQVWRCSPVGGQSGHRRLHRVGRADRDRTLIHDDLVVGHVLADVTCCGSHVLHVGGAVFIGRRTHSDELDGAKMHSLLNVSSKMQASGSDVTTHHFLQAGLVNRNTPVFKNLDLGWIDIQTQHIVANITLSPTAEARIEVNEISRIFQYENEAGIVYLEPNKQKDRIRSSINLSQADIQNLQISECKEPNPSITFGYTATSNQYGHKTGNRLFIPTNVFRKEFSVPPVTKRTYPIYINYGYTDTDSIRIQLPEGYVIEGLPKPLDVKSKFGSFHSGIQVKDKEIYITHRLFMRKGVYSPDEYAAFIDFRKQVAGQYGGKIILKKE